MNRACVCVLERERWNAVGLCPIILLLPLLPIPMGRHLEGTFVPTELPHMRNLEKLLLDLSWQCGSRLIQ